MAKHINIDWSECNVVEIVAGRCGGRPTIRGTRIEPNSIVADAELGSTPAEIHESFPQLPVKTITAILHYSHTHQLVP